MQESLDTICESPIQPQSTLATPQASTPCDNDSPSISKETNATEDTLDSVEAAEVDSKARSELRKKRYSWMGRALSYRPSLGGTSSHLLGEEPEPPAASEADEQQQDPEASPEEDATRSRYEPSGTRHHVHVLTESFDDL